MTDSKPTDVWIEETSKPHTVSVTSVVSPTGLRKWRIDHDNIEFAMERIAAALEIFEPDVVLLAIACAFTTVVRRWQVRVPSLLMAAEQYLRGGDLKVAMQAWMFMLTRRWGDTVSRKEVIKLSKAVNATEAMFRKTQEQIDEEQRQIRVNVTRNLGE